jgi:hypothetical protein
MLDNNKGSLPLESEAYDLLRTKSKTYEEQLTKKEDEVRDL